MVIQVEAADAPEAEPGGQERHGEEDAGFDELQRQTWPAGR
jgi:hypothetical protein